MAAAGLIAGFTLPADLEAAQPPEARGLRRDEVRLLVSDVEKRSIEHARFSELPRWLGAGDLLVVNTSGTLNAALPAAAETGEPLELHLSTKLPGGFWTVEVRRPQADASVPFAGSLAGTSLRLPGNARATLLSPYPLIRSLDASSRLWMAALELPDALLHYLDRYGFPIRYRYVKGRWPSAIYQTVFATEPGSAEMPSAGRPFTPELVTRLVSLGVQIAPILLHTGVASLEKHEPPYEEFYSVSRETAELVNAARRGSRRIVAVGTTVVRALETVTGEEGITSPGEGWTSLIVKPGQRVRAVNALITGFHEPQSTHLALLEAVSGGVSGCAELERAYAEALHARYHWHEFGDSHLILGKR